LALMASRSRARYRPAIPASGHGWTSWRRRCSGTRSGRSRPRAGSSGCGTRTSRLAGGGLPRALRLQRSLTRSRCGRPLCGTRRWWCRRSKWRAGLRSWRRDGPHGRCRRCPHGNLGNKRWSRGFRGSRRRCRRHGCRYRRCRRRWCWRKRCWRSDGRRRSHCRGSWCRWRNRCRRWRSNCSRRTRRPHPRSSRRSILRVFIRFSLCFRCCFCVGNSP
jgi:hypothetical protein